MSRKEKINPIGDLRRRWRSSRGLSERYDLNLEELGVLNAIMEEKTGYTFDRLKREIDFRSSGVIVKAVPPNMDNAALTVASSGSRRVYVFPGGKIAPERMPFSALKFAEFWSRNSGVYMDDVFSGRDKYNAALVRVLDRGAAEEERLIKPLEELAKNIDSGFNDGLSEVRFEVFRELEEELGLIKIGRRNEIRLGKIAEMLHGRSSRQILSGKLEASDMKLLYDLARRLGETDATSGQSGALDIGLMERVAKMKDKDGRDIAYVIGAEPVGLFMDIYRTHQEGAGDDVAKKLFVSFNYLVDVKGNWEDVDRTAKNWYRRKRHQDDQSEIAAVRWVSLPEVAAPGYEELYLDSVHYVARRLGAQGRIIIEARAGYAGGKSNGSGTGPIVVPEPFESQRSSGNGGSLALAALSKR